MKIHIVNWKKYNPKEGQNHTWFRHEAGMLCDHKFHGLSPAQRMVWVCLLYVACDRGTDEFELNLGWFAHHYRLNLRSIRTALDRFQVEGLIQLSEIIEDATPKRSGRKPATNVTNVTNERNETNVSDGVCARARPIRSASSGSRVWDSYSKAYEKRYRSVPVRNVKTNSQLTSLVGRIGGEEAPLVAEFYVWHNDQFYVRQMHPVGLLLRDAEKLRTEWFTGTHMLGTKSREVERMQHNSDSWSEAVEILNRKESIDYEAQG